MCRRHFINKILPGLFFFPAFMLFWISFAVAEEPTIRDLLDRAGIQPAGDRRGQMDTVGFASKAAQMDLLMVQCRAFAEDREKILREGYGWNQEIPLIAGICPHDDYYYASRLYTLLLSRVRAKRVILFGVFHKARIFDCRDRLVFDAYRTWHGPYGPVPVSLLRDDIIKRLPPEDYVVDNDMQMLEHSVEAIIPFLQAYNRDVEIVPILVPYMDWETLDRLASDFSDALTSLIRERGWQAGKDYCFICSADAVHYGDQGWDGSDYAPFGIDVLGYQMAVKRDITLAESQLCGPLRQEKLKGFLNQCVDPKDVKQYRITWCGRFSIPLGLSVAANVLKTVEGRELSGVLLDYGTSVSEPSLEVEGLCGMGPTAPNNFHHFVGYAAVGYR